MRTAHESIKARSALALDQRRRRLDTLERQRTRRSEITATARGVGPGSNELTVFADGTSTDSADVSCFTSSTMVSPLPSASVPLCDDDADCMESDDMDDTRKQRSLLSRARGDVQLSPASLELSSAEWMVDIPSDLGECWYVMSRPNGKRCLVSTGGGLTCAQRRNGRRLSFPSALPGGNRTRARTGSCQLLRVE